MTWIHQEIHLIHYLSFIHLKFYRGGNVRRGVKREEEEEEEEEDDDDDEESWIEEEPRHQDTNM